MSAPRKIYESARATLWLGDCRDVLPEVRTGSCDLMVTDPPYGVAWQSSFGRKTRKRSFDVIKNDRPGELDVPAVLGAWASVLRTHRHVYVFGFSPEKLAPMKLSATAELIWSKGNVPGMGDLSKPFGPAHELFTFGVYGAGHREATPRGGLSARLRKGSVIEVQRRRRAHMIHPTEKPVALMRELVESSSRRDDVVVDPFAGAGASLVAAVMLGRRALGVELDQRYADEAARRIEEAERLHAMLEAA